MKQEYLTRAAISGALWLAMIGMYALLPTGQNAWALLAGAALAIILGKKIMETVSNVTGFTFFFSGFGLLIFYILLMVFSAVIAPLYCVWNLFRYATSREG